MVDSKWLLDGVDENLRNNFAHTRGLYYNQNTKGGNYEKILAEYFEKYLDNLVDFHTRSAILVAQLDALTLFSHGKNEFDVVATFKTASPRIILESRDISYIPLDAVAFIIEVKQTLDKTKLENDIQKMKILKELRLSNRFGRTLIYPMKIFFYYEKKIAKETLEKILVENSDFWDIVIIYQDDRMYANSHLPYIARIQKILKGSIMQFARFNEYSLIQFIIVLQSSLTYSHYVNTLPVFYKLLRDNPPK